MSVFEDIKNLLEKADVEFQVIEHAPVYTSEDASKIRDTSLAIGAKSLIWYADKSPILAVVPGNKKLNLKKFKQAFGFKDLRFATPEEVEGLTGLKIGSIPPIGKVLGLTSYFDESFLHDSQVAFNAGLHTVSILMEAKNLIKVEDPLLANIT